MTMTKEEFKELVEAQPKEALIELMISEDWLSNEDEDIEETSEFIFCLVDDDSLPELARIIKDSNLTLTCNYIRTAIYYEDYKESDELTELVDDDELDEFIEYYVDSIKPEDYEKESTYLK